MELFKTTKIFDFVRASKIGLIFSGLALFASVWLFFAKGFILGIDFSGGTLAELRYEKPVEISVVRHAIAQNPSFSGAVIATFGTKNEISIKIPVFEGEKNIGDELSRALSGTGAFQILKLDSVGAKVGSDLLEKGVMSLVMAVLAMMAYVSFRYEWRFALAGILALVHDIVIAAASIIIFGIDLNLEVIAALLTLLGYSINDTIIIFDRIREQIIQSRENSLTKIINEAISRTLSRTLLTSLTVFFVVVVLYIFGSSNITGFSLPMLVGVIVGTYSSLFVAPKLMQSFGFSVQKYREKQRIKAQKIEDKKRLRSRYEGGVV